MIITDIHEKYALSDSGLYEILCDVQEDTGIISKRVRRIITEKQFQEYIKSKGKK